MYSSKGQWFLIGAVVLVIVLSSLYPYRHVATEKEILIEEPLLIKEKYILSKVLSVNFEENETVLKENLLFASDLLKRNALEKGIEVESFFFCVFNDSRSLLVLSSFQNLSFKICSLQTCVNDVLEAYEFKSYAFSPENFVDVELFTEDGELCTNHTFRTDFCAGIFVLREGRERFVGRTLNLNAC